MKSSIICTFVLASIAAVCAAPTAEINALTVSQGNTIAKMEKVIDNRHPEADVIAITKQEGAPVTNEIKQEVAPVRDIKPEFVDEGYTPFFINSPSKGDTYVKGSTTTIQWINGSEGPFVIHVLTGKVPGSMQRTSVSLQAEGTDGSLNWVVDKHLTPGNYALQFVYNKANGEKKMTYSDQFTIVNA